MIAQRRAQKSACDIKVYRDKESLALRFPRRHKELMQWLMDKIVQVPNFCLPLGKYGFKNNPDDWKRAELLALQLESDLDHPSWKVLFDPTFAKYGICDFKSAVTSLAIVSTPPPKPKLEITIGSMWEHFLAIKVKQVQPTTFHAKYERTYPNALKAVNGLWDCPLDSEAVPGLVSQIVVNSFARNVILTALVDAFSHLQATNKTELTRNPFVGLKVGESTDIREQYKPSIDSQGESIPWYVEADKKSEASLENDYRAFTKEQRDIIIEAFYNSDSTAKRQIAPYIHFLFLTGCRPGEASALEWGDILFDSGIIRFSKSYNAELKNIQTTKTKEIRTFRIYPALLDLLHSIRPADIKSRDIIFTNTVGDRISSKVLGNNWRCKIRGIDSEGKELVTWGVVGKLVEDGILPFYLPAYHCRHTYITLTANANKEDNKALLHIASACGNSVDVIIKHYLGVTEKPEIKHV